MSEIWNLSAICRCCHADGHFKSLLSLCKTLDYADTYSTILRDTFGVNILPPPFDASYSICDMCMTQIKQAFVFKKQVLLCEKKFEEYCRNEQALENIKIEIDLPGAEDNSFKDAHQLESDDDDDKSDKDIDIKNALKISIEEIKECKTEDNVTVIKNENNVELYIEKIEKKEKDFKKKCKSTPKKTKAQKLEEEKQHITNYYKKTESKFICDICNSNYQDGDTIFQHITETHKDVVYKCKNCNMTLKNYDNLRQHNLKHEIKEYKCDVCQNEYFSKKSLTAHVKIHKTRYQCDICKKYYFYKTTLKRHLLWHSGLNKKFVCDKCGNSFNDKTNLFKHIKTVHEKIRAFCCSFCPKTYTAKKHLVDHIRIHTNERPFKCDVCFKSFTNRVGLKAHLSVHEGIYKCRICKEVYKDRGSFVAHVRKHAGSLPYKCKYCNKDFSCSYSKSRHEKNHSGIRPHSCNVCHMSFFQKGTLKRHIERHHEAKVVPNKTKCDVCKKYYTDIKKHSECHTIKPFACDFCDKSYSLKTGLVRHTTTVHDGKVRHPCDMCHKKYVNSNGLRAHKLKVHKVPLKTEIEEHFDGFVNKYTIAKCEN